MFIAAGLVILLFWFTIRVWLMIFAGVLLALFLRGLSDWIGRKLHIAHGWSLTLVIVGLMAVFGLTGWLMAPRVGEQVQQLSRQLPTAFHQLIGQIRQSPVGQVLPQSLAASGLGRPEILSRVKDVFNITFGVIAGILVIVFTGVYVAADPDLYVRGFVSLFPIHRRRRARDVIQEVTRTLRNWILGQLCSMTVVGVLIGVGLHFIGIPLALLLGILAGVTDFIPIAGPIISGAPAVLLALVKSPLYAVYVIALFVVVNSLIEGHLLIPLIQRYAVSLPPVVTIVALVMMGMVFGFLGVLLATPIATAALVLIRMVYVEDVLGDR